MKKSAYKILRAVWKNFCCVVTLFSPYLNTQLLFFRANGKIANLNSPKTFSEKISWLKLYRYGDDPLVKQCADKYAVREYVKKCDLGHLLNPIIAVYASEEEIVWESLPQAFALKWNFGCGFSFLCSDKSEHNEQKVRQLLCKWRKKPFWLEASEFQYKVDKKYLICERYLKPLPGEDLLDYKVYCFHSKALAILVIRRTSEKEKAAIFMDLDWNVISGAPKRYSDALLPERPICLQEMIAAAECLAEPFPFVRVDFYQHQGELVFGEMTFTPSAGISPSETEIEGKPMGEFLMIIENAKG